MFQEIPKHVNSKFFNYPAIVPPRFSNGFMPRGGESFKIDAVEEWCFENLGSKNEDWTRRSHYFFVKPDMAFMFKMRWC